MEEKKKKTSSFNEEEIQKEFEKIEQNTPEIEKPQDDVLHLEKLEEPTYNKDEIEQQIEDMLEATYNKKQQQEETAKQENTTKLEESKKKAQELFNENVEKVDDAYTSYRNEAENNALKRGLARSSIVIQQLDGIEKQKADSFVALQRDLTETLQNIDSDMLQLEKEYTQALNQLDLEKAQEKAQMLDEKYQEYLKTKQEVIEFNNKVEQAQKEYEAEKQQNAWDQALEKEKFKQEYGYEPSFQTPQEAYEAKVKEREKSIAKQKYEYVKPMFDAMEPTEALQVLENSSVLKQQLGIHYYDLLYTLKRRES